MPESPNKETKVEVALWIVQIALALVFLMAGGMKLARPKEDLMDQMAWVEDFSQGSVRAIGIIEILGALGLILPAVFGIVPALVGWAGLGLAVSQVVAAGLHVKRDEGSMVLRNAIFVLMGLFVAWGRLGDYPL